MAISCARRILVMVSGHQAPAFTVASLATITARAAFDFADAGDHARRGGLAVVLVVGDEQADFEEQGAGIEQRGNALARRHLPGAMLALDAGRAAAFAQPVFQRLQLADKQSHLRGARQPGGSLSLRIHSLGIIVPRARGGAYGATALRGFAGKSPLWRWLPKSNPRSPEPVLPWCQCSAPRSSCPCAPCACWRRAARMPRPIPVGTGPRSHFE